MGDIVLAGATSGTTTLTPTAVSGTTTLTLPATTGTMLTNASQLVGTGTTTNDSAAAGYVGEYISSTVTSISGVSLTTATFANITSISLTAGDWDVSGVVAVSNPGSTTFAYINYGVSTTSAANGSLGQVGSLTTPSTIAAVVDFVTPVPVTRLSLSLTTTVYLVTRASFAVSTASAYGVIRARRIR